ncbi:9523_t:CDS:2 [Ambispora gerdemannii]|uniref:Peptide hydrolase n=1 Tax=Ambispora gerdemannii TaxID=144530 RepID=A0A9N9AH66_9GLOM|nr:9523_t:CDS:2 [Ambispora gerdemannii]
MVKLLPLVSLLLSAIPVLILARPYEKIHYHIATLNHHHKVNDDFGAIKSNSIATKLDEINADARISGADEEDEDELRLIQLSEDEPAEWMTVGEIMDLYRKKTKFMDITDHQDLGDFYKATTKTRQFPVQPQFQNEVKPFIKELTTKHMEENLKKFTSFRTRYYRSRTGKESSNWLYEQILGIIKKAENEVNVSVRKFEHSWAQNSLIARFEGADEQKENEVVIIAAHQDSVNMWMPSFGRAPGADDDGSGTVTILEAFRVLVENGFKPERPVEFHWYSAEEAGLLGSQAIAQEYAKEKKDVIAMLQNDMTGYVGKKPETFGIVTDYVNSDLTIFIKSLIEEYAAIPYTDTKCGYACSDHASWGKAGYPSAFAIESEFSNSNPYIHSTNDVLENLDFNHMLEFSKLSVSLAVELSHI